MIEEEGKWGMELVKVVVNVPGIPGRSQPAARLQGAQPASETLQAELLHMDLYTSCNNTTPHYNIHYI